MTSLPSGDLLLENGTVIPMEKRQPCEVYSRVVGYLRPVRQWNKGKFPFDLQFKQYENVRLRQQFFTTAGSKWGE